MQTSFFVSLCLFGFVVLSCGYSNPKLVNLVNSNPSSTWRASENSVFKNWSQERIRGYFNSGIFEPKDPRRVKPFKGLEVALPDNFDSAQNWPKCPSMSQIRDQAECGSCWA